MPAISGFGVRNKRHSSRRSVVEFDISQLYCAFDRDEGLAYLQRQSVFSQSVCCSWSRPRRYIYLQLRNIWLNTPRLIVALISEQRRNRPPRPAATVLIGSRAATQT